MSAGRGRPISAAAFYSSTYSGGDGGWNPLAEDPNRVMLSARGNKEGPPTARKAWGQQPQEWGGGLRSRGEPFLDSEEIDRQMRELKRECVSLKRANVQLQTRLRRSEAEQSKLSRDLEDSMKVKGGTMRGDRIGQQTSIVNGLKQQIHKLERELRQGQEALAAYKQDTRYTRTIELEQETAVYFQEARRLSQLLTEADTYRGHLEEEITSLKERLGKYKTETKQERGQRKVLERALKGDTLVDSPSGLPPQRIDVHGMAQQLDEAKTEVDAAKSREIALRGEIAMLNRSVSRLENDLGQAREAAQNAEESLDHLKVQADEQAGALRLSQEQVSVLQSEVDESRATADGLRNEVGTMTKTKLALETQVLDTEKELQTVRMEFAGAEARITTLMDENSGKQEQIDHLRGERAELADDTTERIRALEADREKSMGRVRDLTDELDRIKLEREGEVNEVIERLNKRVDELKNENSELSSDLEVQAKHTDEMIASAQEYEKLLGSEQSVSSNLRTEVEAIKTSMREAQREVDKLRVKLAKEGRTLHDQEEKNKVLTAELAELKGKASLAPEPMPSPRYVSPAPPRPVALDEKPKRKASISDARTHVVVDAARGDDLKLGEEVESEAFAITDQLGGGHAVSLYTDDEAATVIQTGVRQMLERKKEKGDEFVVQTAEPVEEDEDPTEAAHRAAMMAAMGDSEEDPAEAAHRAAMMAAMGDSEEDPAEAAHRAAMMAAMGDSEEDPAEAAHRAAMMAAMGGSEEDPTEAAHRAAMMAAMGGSEEDPTEAAHRAAMMAAMGGSEDEDEKEEEKRKEEEEERRKKEEEEKRKEEEEERRKKEEEEKRREEEERRKKQEEEKRREEEERRKKEEEEKKEEERKTKEEEKSKEEDKGLDPSEGDVTPRYDDQGVAKDDDKSPRHKHRKHRKHKDEEGDGDEKKKRRHRKHKEEGEEGGEEKKRRHRKHRSKKEEGEEGGEEKKSHRRHRSRSTHGADGGSKDVTQPSGDTLTPRTLEKSESHDSLADLLDA